MSTPGSFLVQTNAPRSCPQTHSECCLPIVHWSAGLHVSCHCGRGRPRASWVTVLSHVGSLCDGCTATSGQHPNGAEALPWVCWQQDSTCATDTAEITPSHVATVPGVGTEARTCWTQSSSVRAEHYHRNNKLPRGSARSSPSRCCLSCRWERR